jgi:uncharacterized protein YdeI (YjbR/CyaY-like superfamily)
MHFRVEMVNSAETFFHNGCGRCPLGGTPDCKVHAWTQPLLRLRYLLLDSGLTETLKWGVACYTHQGKNVILLGAFKDTCMISFLRGALLSDQEKILELPGEHSNAGRIIRFRSAQEVAALEDTLRAYIQEAIVIEEQGLKVPSKSVDQYPMPEELTEKFAEFSGLETAFRALTPGRQKGYLIFFSQPKQSATRHARILKCAGKILEGKGLND